MALLLGILILTVLTVIKMVSLRRLNRAYKLSVFYGSKPITTKTLTDRRIKGGHYG